MAQKMLNKSRAALPLAVPLVIGYPASSWVMLKAIAAHNNSICHLELPWSAERSLQILSQFFPAAWKEVQEFATLSTQCLASLHADIASAYYVIFAVSMVAGIVSAPLSGVFQGGPIIAQRIDLIKGVIAMYCGAAAFIVISLFAIYGPGIVDFENKRSIAVSLDAGYINIFSYWFLSQVLFYSAAFGLWWLSTATALLWRGANYNKQQ
ncbi:hypothetical protein [Microvirga solisilvae]|uniref:hypothetical protein n=1 Tax=Microvirga solisilvae TaxID=2919498 RepID=UPI001FAFA4E6|nr:hypothetical protein [Microvirga solisilvae]